MTAETRRGSTAAVAAVIAILAGLAAIFQHPVIDDLPFGVHAWAQGDSLAIAQRYYEDESWNIFDPHARSLFAVDGRVNRELPLVPWLAAVAARLGGPGVLVPAFRGVTLILSLLGPLALFLITFGRSRSLSAPLLPMVFLATAPVFVWYSGNFLPDAPALGLFLVGVWILLRSPEGTTERDLVLAMVPLAMAAMMKISFSVQVAFLAGTFFLGKASGGDGRSWPQRLSDAIKDNRWAAAAAVTSGLVLVAQFLFLRFREWVYSPTYFTASPHPFRSLALLKTTVGRIEDRWLAELLPWPHVIVLVLAVVWIVVRRRQIDRGLLRALGATCAAGLVLFFLFGGQYEDHDYYFIAAFYPWASLAAAAFAADAASVLRARSTATRTAAVTLLLIGAGLMTWRGEVAQMRRSSQWFHDQELWLSDAREILDYSGVAGGEAVAVLGSLRPNQPLTILGRNGYVLGTQPGLGLPPADKISSIRRVLWFMRRQGVRALVIRRDGFSELPQAQLEAGFRSLGSTERVVVLVPIEILKEE